MGEKLDLSKLYGQPKEYDINGLTMMLHPLSVNELPILLKTGKEETQAEGMLELVKKTLEMSGYNAEEEMKKISVSNFQALIEAIMDVNNLEVDKKKLDTMVSATK